MSGNFALTMDYAGNEVSEIQYLHDRAKYFNEIPDRAAFIALCESLLEHERQCENVAERMIEESECSYCDDIARERDLKEEEREAEEKRANFLETLAVKFKKYLEAIEPRNKHEKELLREICEVAYL